MEGLEGEEKRAGSAAAPPRVLSRAPGRLRAHLPGWDGAGADHLAVRLSQVPGVLRVEASSLTGNVLLRFDPRTLAEEVLLASLGSAQPEARPNRPPSHSRGADRQRGLEPGRGRALLQAGLRGLLGHAAVDALFYTVVFAEPFGLPLAGLGLLHLGLDVFVWGAALASVTPPAISSSLVGTVSRT